MSLRKAFGIASLRDATPKALRFARNDIQKSGMLPNAASSLALVIKRNLTQNWYK
jgi:hypothetical protein